MIKKIVLTVAIVLVSILLLCVFVLYNFPYESLAERVDGVLRDRTGVSFSVGETRYIFPLKLRLADVRVRKDDPPFHVEIGEVLLRLRLRKENVEVSGSGFQVKSSNADVRGSYFRLSSGVRLFRLREGFNPSHIDSATFRTDRARVERAIVSGFEFSSFVVSEVFLSLKREEQNLTFEQGFIKSELFTSQITGTFSSEAVDIDVVVKPTEKFLRNYSNLRGMLASFFEDEILRLSITGDSRRPAVSIENGPGI